MGKTAQANAADTDRRCGHREQIRDYFTAYRAQSGDLFGDLLDLSDSGMRLACPEPVDPGSVTDVEIAWQDSAGETKRFALRLEARWCRAANNGTVHVAGFRVVDATPVQRMALQMMVSNFVSRGS